MKSLFLSITMVILLIGALPTPSYALRKPRPTPIDSRIQVINYNPDDVFQYTGFYMYQSSIEFAADEVIETISMGDTTAWQIVPSGRRMFLKPVEQDATTNMTVLTNKRTYHFELHAKEAEGIHDPDMVFMVRFIYAQDSQITMPAQQMASVSAPDLSEPEQYNFHYTISGSDIIAPLRIFDDGEFTYFQFRNKNAEVPAFFIVDAEGRESIVNYHMAGDYIAIERVAERYTLRSGAEITCVFNENFNS